MHRCARAPSVLVQQPARAIRAVGLRDLRRSADRAAADRRRGSNIDLVRQLVQAHAYWRLKGLAVDLVIWNEDHDGYRQRLQEQILGLIAAGVEAHFVDRPGGIFVRHAEQISAEDRICSQSVARAIITDSRGTLAEQINRRARRPRRAMPRLRADAHATGRSRAPPNRRARDLILFNGLGGFTPDGREYVIAPGAGKATPAPWVERAREPALRHRRLGKRARATRGARTRTSSASRRGTTIRSATRAARRSTFATKRPGISGRPRPLPGRGAAPYVTRHGFGYSVFEHTEDGIRSELTVFVALDAAVKFFVLKMRNQSGRPRRLSVDRLRRVGTGRSAREVRDARDRPRSTPGAARCTRAIRTTANSPNVSRSSTSTT